MEERSVARAIGFHRCTMRGENDTRGIVPGLLDDGIAPYVEPDPGGASGSTAPVGDQTRKA